jgi:transcriptional regulator with GAF, ATPase, and Fis domain
MIDVEKSWRFFLQSPWLQAGAMGLVATILSLGLWTAAPAMFTVLDWTVYDLWLRHRALIPVSPSLVIIARDQAGEAMFGQGLWDRAVLARVISAVHEAGAQAIGLNHRLDRPSPAQLGGAASDTLLIEAAKAAGNVVFVFDSESPLGSDTMRSGHVLVSAGQDLVVRSAPPSALLGPHTVPAFGLSLYEMFRQQTVSMGGFPSTGSEPTVLVNYAGDGTLAPLRTIPFSSVWESLDGHARDRLDRWFKGKVVIFLSDPTLPTVWRLPTGLSVGESIIQMHFLNMLLTDNRVRRVGAPGSDVMAWLLASLVAWSLLSWRGLRGHTAAGVIVITYGGLLVGTLAFANLVLPLAMPITAALFVLIGTTFWSHLTASQRLVLLERDMLRVQQDAAAVREVLVLRESRAEALQEDLEVARATILQSASRQEELTKTTELLRAQVAEAQRQEEAARHKLEALDRQLYDLRAASSETLRLSDAELDRLREDCGQLGIVTCDPTLLGMFRDLRKGAKSSLTVLLLGEPGTGKELFARAVHRLSQGGGRPFIAVNMAAISPELFESELFGHVKGSFTGAATDRRGYFELAHQGTIFLDEIGDLRLDHQSKLLRVLQEKSFYRVGASTPSTVDVRVVAATNRDLQRGVTEGWFREDLYFRLKGLLFHLPPLRERMADLPILAETFLAEIASQMGRPVPKLSNEALRLLVDYEWKGNVRELHHCLEQAVALADGLVLTKESLRLRADGKGQTGARTKSPQILPDPASDAAVLNCLRQHDFDMQATARTLGWDRSTVTQRLKGLCFQALVEAAGDQTKAVASIAGDTRHLRIVELKLMDYYGHLLATIESSASADEALLDCRRRFKNLPERHFRAVESLVRRYFTKPVGAPTSLQSSSLL